MKNKENGRSMVEMLGVLTVIALLSISGLYGYTRAMTKHKTNEVINSANKRAVMVAAQIAALGDSADEESLNAVWEEYDENGEYGTGEVSTGTSTSPNNRDYRVRRDKSAKEFSLVVPQMEKEICHEILNSIGNGSQIKYLLTSDGYEMESKDCDKEEKLKDVEIVYNEDLSPSEGNKTTYLDSDIGNGTINGPGNSSGNLGQEDTDFEEGDNTNDSNNVCPRGQKKWEESCVFCNQFDNCGCRVLGQVADGEGACMCPDDGVAECEGNTAIECEKGYFLENGKCHSCPAEYQTCDNTGLVCKENYCLILGDCKSFSNCQKCENGTIQNLVDDTICDFNGDGNTSDGYCKSGVCEEKIDGKTCTSNLDCNNGSLSGDFYCQAYATKTGPLGRSTATNCYKDLTGKCKPKGTLPAAKMVNGIPTYRMSECENKTWTISNLSWWTSNNLCLAHGKKLFSVEELNCYTSSGDFVSSGGSGSGCYAQGSTTTYSKEISDLRNNYGAVHGISYTSSPIYVDSDSSCDMFCIYLNSMQVGEGAHNRNAVAKDVLCHD